ncbi:MAG TPA: tRNA (adenosine(37)-N6)-threonylcarbamoyltransferase complex dimerization subunit type 1 TsaB [Methylomirabilota bacterium]
MRLLAVETSTMTGAVGLLEGGRVVAESRVSVAVTHGERLMAAIDGVLRAARWELGDLEAFAVALGPGSFTGLRIGLSTVKGLAFATGKPAIGVPTLEALAWRLPYCAYPVCPVLDARKNEVYAALYRTLEGRLELLEAPRAVAPATLAEDLRATTSGPVVFVGDAVGPFGPVLGEILGARAHLAPADLRLPSAVTVGELGARALARGETADPADLVPLYLRPSEAELARERRQSAGRPD